MDPTRSPGNLPNCRATSLRFMMYCLLNPLSRTLFVTLASKTGITTLEELKFLTALGKGDVAQRINI